MQYMPITAPNYRSNLVMALYTTVHMSEMRLSLRTGRKACKVKPLTLYGMPCPGYFNVEYIPPTLLYFQGTRNTCAGFLHQILVSGASNFVQANCQAAKQLGQKLYYASHESCFPADEGTIYLSLICAH